VSEERELATGEQVDNPLDPKHLERLTKRELEVWKLRFSEDPPMSHNRIADKLGIERGTAKSIFSQARKRLRVMPGDLRDTRALAQRVEHKNPELAAEVIDLATTPELRSLASAIRECDLPKAVAVALMKRMQTEYQPVHRELKRVKTETLVREFESLSLRSIRSITDEDLREVNAYQRTLIGAIAADKRELLDGRPTERISLEDRRKLPELLQALMTEARRRGLGSATDPQTGEVKMVRSGERSYVDDVAKKPYKPKDPFIDEATP